MAAALRTALPAALAGAALACAPPPEARWPEPSAVVAAPPARTDPDAARPFVAVEHPPRDSVFGDAPAYLAGHARAPLGVRHHDVVVVVDVSGSTRADASDPDPGSTRILPGEPTPPGSVLAAEVEAARALLAQLDFRATRVGLVAFSGEPQGAPRDPYRGLHGWDADPAWTVRTLSRRPEALDAALDAILAEGPQALTDMAAGLRRAVAELVGGPEAESRPDPTSAKVVVFLTDGVPTLPHPGSRARNERAVLEEVDRAAAYGIRIHAYGIGARALEGPLPLVEMARRTGGLFVPVRDPASLPEILPRLRFGAVTDLRVRNRTTGEPALAARLRGDGSFDALVRLAPGPNRVEITARAADGATASAVVRLERRADAPDVPVPPRLEPRRAEVGELRDARRVELWDEILREREAAERRAAERRRELELEAADGEAGAGAPGLSPPAAP